MPDPTFLDRKHVLVTGTCGTVGSELAMQLVKRFGVERLTAIDNCESGVFYLKKRFLGQGIDQARVLLADVRDRDRLLQLTRDVDIIFHTAAFKHVATCEESVAEAVQTNVDGARNVIHAAEANDIERVIFTSSDKAVSPTNVMGATKLIAERMFCSAAALQPRGGTVFASTRFGNVLGSSGSVIPVFRRQIEKGGPITVTDPDMTRFVMSLDQAINLVIDTARLAHGGEVFITKMPVIRIGDLARVMIDELAPAYGHAPASIAIDVTGALPGEKHHEALLGPHEVARAWELERYFVITPPPADAAPDRRREQNRRAGDNVSAYEYPGLISRSVDREYESHGEPALTRSELLEFLRTNRLLETPASAGASVTTAPSGDPAIAARVRRRAG